MVDLTVIKWICLTNLKLGNPTLSQNTDLFDGESQANCGESANGGGS